MFRKKCVILGVMLMTGVCVAQFPGDYDINVSYVSANEYQGVEYTYFTCTANDDYLVEIVAYNGWESQIYQTDTNWSTDEWLAVSSVEDEESVDFIFMVKTRTEVCNTAFYMFLYHDDDNSKSFNVGDDLLDMVTIDTY